MSNVILIITRSKVLSLLFSIIVSFIVLFQHYFGVLPLSSSLPISQSRWADRLTHSIPHYEEYPKHLLSTPEQDFLLWLQSFKVSSYYDLLSSLQLAEKIMELWSGLLVNISVPSLAKHLVKQKVKSSNRSYANREYCIGKRKVGLWLFRKGLVRGYAVPVSGAKLQYKYGYPLKRYRLVERNFRSPFPPHDYFASLCYSKLLHGVSQSVFHKVDPTRYTIPHWDSSGFYVADNCYCLTLHGQTKYLWTEVHSGSEGYDERTFLKRLLTMERYLYTHPLGLYVVFVPFVRDVTTALDQVTAYNSHLSDSFPLTLNHIRLTHYYGMATLKESIGIYQHQYR